MTVRQPGEMREVVELQKSVRTDTDAGGYVDNWQPVATVRAKVEPLRGSEQIQARAVTAVFDYRVTIRHRHDIGPDWRLIWKRRAPATDVEMSIVSFPQNNDQRRRYLEINCLRGKAA